MSAILALQRAIEARLSTDTKLLTLIPIDLEAEKEEDIRLYDYIPSAAKSPYIHIDGPQAAPDNMKTTDVQDITITIHIWHNQLETSRYGNGRPVAMLQAVKDALRYKLILPNHEVLQTRIQTERIFEDTNADVKHGVFSLVFKVKTKV